ncbi:hypothetical protein AMTRI_Chr11g99150 [Amborella trichopoda]
MASQNSSPPLQQRLKVDRKFMNAFSLLLLLLLLSFMSYRLATLPTLEGLEYWFWALALACETWFTWLWLLSINGNWNPVLFKTYPERLPLRFKSELELPAIDVFVTTADPFMEPPIIVINTVLSILAVDYPTSKFAVYVSDDACSIITFYSLSMASEFARTWVPFCKKHNVSVRAPFMYFSDNTAASDSFSPEFLSEWKMVKVFSSQYEELCRRVSEAVSGSCKYHQYMRSEDLAFFSRIERGDHPSVVKVIVENGEKGSEGVGHLIYIGREKRRKHRHHFKAGAMNTLFRVSGVMTNAPFTMNVDCDMFVNNPRCFYEALCLLFGFESEREAGFVQFPQVFYGGLKDDPFGNQLKVLYHTLGRGFAGLQGMLYSGTGCFHRRKAIYGAQPPELPNGKGQLTKYMNGSDEAKMEELESIFGHSEEFLKSVVCILSEDGYLGSYNPVSLASTLEAAHEVAQCTYENHTQWGDKVGLVYGSTTEDVLSGLRLHSMGWKSASCTPEPPGFLGCAPSSGPESLTQSKRWATGLLEVLVGSHSPLLAVVTKKLQFRQCWAYITITVWALCSLPELCYATLPAICILTGRSFLPKVTQSDALFPISLFILFNLYSIIEYWQIKLSLREWWNNQRMARINCTSAWLFGLFDVILKLLHLSETVFVVTPKDDHGSSGDEAKDRGRLTFDSSLLFLPPTTLLLLNLAALGAGIPMLTSGDISLVGEMVCSAWVVASFFPFAKGLVRKGRYGLPWSTIFKSGVIASFIVHVCRYIA